MKHFAKSMRIGLLSVYLPTGRMILARCASVNLANAGHLRAVTAARCPYPEIVVLDHVRIHVLWSLSRAVQDVSLLD